MADLASVDFDCQETGKDSIKRLAMTTRGDHGETGLASEGRGAERPGNGRHDEVVAKTNAQFGPVLHFVFCNTLEELRPQFKHDWMRSRRKHSQR